MRCFIALVPDTAARERIVAAAACLGAALPRFRLVHPEDLHLTLVFHGEIGEEALEASKAALVTLAPTGPIQLRFDRLLAIPRPGAARVLAIGSAKDSGAARVASLRAALQAALARVALERGLACLDPEADRNLLVHLTLARSGGRGIAVALDPAWREMEAKLQAPLGFGACILFGSRPSRAGARYELIESLSLSEGAARGASDANSTPYPRSA